MRLVALQTQVFLAGCAVLVQSESGRLQFRPASKDAKAALALVTIDRTDPANPVETETVLFEGRYSSQTFDAVRSQVEMALGCQLPDLPNRQQTVEVQADAPAKTPKSKLPPNACLCGCGATTSSHKSRFVQGHDQRLASMILKGDTANLSPEQLTVGQAIIASKAAARAAKAATKPVLQAADTSAPTSASAPADTASVASN